MKTLYLIAIIGVTLLGILHSLLTWRTYPSINTEAFWFMSAGLALLFAGIANYMNFQTNTSFSFQCVLIINIILGIFTIFLAIKESQPTTIAVAVFSAILLISSIMNHVRT
jgi:hypothetical protein